MPFFLQFFPPGLLQACYRHGKAQGWEEVWFNLFPGLNVCACDPRGGANIVDAVDLGVSSIVGRGVYVPGGPDLLPPAAVAGDATCCFWVLRTR